MFSRGQASAAPAPGDVVCGYRIEALLGEGAMGAVFRAVGADGATVALKLVKEHLSGDETYRRRFLHEARAAAAVSHPHLVEVLDTGDVDGRQYLAMRFIDGVALDERVRTEGTLPLAAAGRLAWEIGGALEALHDAGLVHRDVKASNIVLAADGASILADFGLAKGEGYSVLTAPGNILGTLDYLAPERIGGEAGAPAADVYALGCVLVEALTGEPPFGGRSTMQVAFAHLEETPPDPRERRPDLPEAATTAILASLAKAPADRPTAGSLAETLRETLGDG